MRASVRYWLFQLPGLLLAGSVATFLYTNEWITGWTALYIVLGWLLKDLVLYPLTIHAYHPHTSQTLLDRMVGLRGVVKRRLDPEGLIQVRGERWKAVTVSSPPIPTGEEVVVVDAQGMTLQVERASSSQQTQ